MRSQRNLALGGACPLADGVVVAENTELMTSTVLGPTLAIVCLVMAAAAAVVYRIAQLGPWWAVPGASVRAAAQLAAVSAILGLAIAELWSSVVVLGVMVLVAAWTAARRSQADVGSAWVALPIAAGLTAVIPLLLGTGLVPLDGMAIVPVVGIVLGGTMTAVSVASRRALDTLTSRAGEVDAALSLGLSERDSRFEVISRAAADALLPNVDQARTAGLVTLPGAFVGVLLSTGSAAQAGAVQVLVLVALLLSQSCAVAVTRELVARGRIARKRDAVVR
ncbi:ABC transporter permease [soil metagenome]